MSQSRSLAPRPRPRTDIGAASPTRRLVPARALSWAIAAAVCVCFGAAPRVAFSACLSKTPEISRRWTIVKRVQTQDQGDWQVDYDVRLDSPSPVRLEPSELELTVRGAVSNSRVPAHAFARPISATLNAKNGLNVLTDVIPSASELVRCRERLVARFWSTEDLGERSPRPIAPHPPLSASASPAFEPMPAVSVVPGGLLHVRVRLEHDHFLHGPYDPLLGLREVELKLGVDAVRDVVPLDREQYLVQGREDWATPPVDRRDTRHFVSAPDSLCLEAHIPGNQSYRFTERPVRYATKMRLSFWYLIAPGTVGDFRMQVTQYKDSPIGWQILHAGMIEKSYKGKGRWAKAEYVFRTESQATSLALTYSLVGSSEVGEVWIDDVKLEPVSGSGERP